MRVYNNFVMLLEDYQPITSQDEQEIIKALGKDIEIRVDEVGRVWTEGDIYIADVTER